MDITVDTALTAAQVQRGLQQFYGTGQAGRAGPRVSDVALLGSGYETDVFAFALESAGEVQDLILRVYAGEGASEKSAREFDAMGRLREAGYPVPRVRVLQRDGSLFGRPFVIMERIDGVSLESAYWSAPDGRKQEYQALHYRLMAQLHALPGSALFPDSPPARDPYGPLDQELAFLSEMLARLEGDEPPSLRKALAWLTSRRSGAPCERLTIVHGDFHRNNVLIRADGVPFVIDWSNVRLADYRMDLAWTRLIARLITRAAAQPDEGQAALHLYEEFAGKAVSLLEYFDAAVCLRLLLSVLISLQFGSARQGMRPEAEALMRRDAAGLLHVASLLQAQTGIEMPDLEETLAALLGG